MFHLLNAARERRCFVLLTARTPPGDWGLATPDLLSRLRLAPSAVLGDPDEALVRAILVKLFLERQIVIDTSVVEFLAARIERSVTAAKSMVEALDREGWSAAADHPAARGGAAAPPGGHAEPSGSALGRLTRGRAGPGAA